MKNEMSFNDLQNQIKSWGEYNFPNKMAYMPLIGAIEEVGELEEEDNDSKHLFELFKSLSKMCHAQLKIDQKVRINENHRKNIADGIADCIIFLTDYATQHDLKMQDLIEETWNKVKQRDWKKFPVNGLNK